MYFYTLYTLYMELARRMDSVSDQLYCYFNTDAIHHENMPI